MSKVSFITLGCSKNTVDSQVMMGILDDSGHEITENLAEADFIVINTCSFINDAKEESINTILDIAELKDEYKDKKIIVTGCLTQRYHKILLEEMPEIDGMLGTGNQEELVDLINQLSEESHIIKIDGIHNPYYEGTNRAKFNEGHIAYVKIAEGCDNRCSYCIIPKLRGKFRSRKIEDIVAEAKELGKNGTKEIVLIAQDTSKYGIDLYDEYSLPKLLDELNKVEEIDWIRILYIYPETFTDELIQSVKRNEKVVKYVDIPIQHINNEILKRMNRKTTREDIILLIEKLRREIPEIIIRTTLIVGFPGETEEYFEELLKFIKEYKFDRLGAFSYSHEEDTPSYKLDNQVDEDIKNNRREIIMEAQLEISIENNEKKVHNIYDVLIDEIDEDGNIYIGRTYMDAPEIDGIVFFTSDNIHQIGDLVKVKITESMEYDLKGELSNELAK